MAKVALPGLTDSNSASPFHSDSDGFIQVIEKKMSGSKAPKNPFERIGIWEGEVLDRLEIKVGDVNETTVTTNRTQEATHAQSKSKQLEEPKTRHWRSNVTFSLDGKDSSVIKAFGCGIPRAKSTAYGENYCYAKLPRAVADKIIAAYAAKGHKVTCIEDRIQGGDDEWWATVNNIANETGFTKNKQFVAKPLNAIFAKSEGGIVANIDFTVHAKLRKTDGSDRNVNDVFTLSVTCSRIVIQNINEDVPAPEIKSQIPTLKMSKEDVISDELAALLDSM